MMAGMAGMAEPNTQFPYLVGTEENPMPLLAPTDNWLSSPPVPSGDAYVIFYSSRDDTGRMWCPDCRNIESQVDNAFRGDDKPRLFVIYVGSRDEWKLPAKNRFRTDYTLIGVPTLIKYQNGQEVARTTESNPSLFPKALQTILAT